MIHYCKKVFILICQTEKTYLQTTTVSLMSQLKAIPRQRTWEHAIRSRPAAGSGLAAVKCKMPHVASSEKCLLIHSSLAS